MICSFATKETEGLFQRKQGSKLPAEIHRKALRKLVMLNAAVTLADLKVPPGNRLEKLKGNRAGQLSIRINSQWRICFRFANGHAFDVEITDYH